MTRAHLRPRCCQRKLQNGKTDTEIEHGQSQSECPDKIDPSSHADITRQNTDRNERNRIAEDAAGGRTSVLLDDGQHLDSASFIVFAVQPRDREKMRELPHEK